MDTGGNMNEGRTQVDCLVEEKADGGRVKERETKLPNGSSVECPYVSLNANITEYGDYNEREAQLRCRKQEKTGDTHQEERETRLTNGNSAGCPYACPPIISSSFGHLASPSPRLAELLEGAGIPGDSGNPPEPPEWLDRELFDEGRRFYKNYLVCLVFSELLTLAMNLVQEYGLKPLIYTGRSDSPAKARRRYMSTSFHLIFWFEGDVWDASSPAHRDLLSIRTTHRRLGRTFNQPGEYEKVFSVSVEARGYPQPPDSILPAIKKDLRAAGVKELTKKENGQLQEYPVVISHGTEEHGKKTGTEINQAMTTQKETREQEEENVQKRQEFPTFMAQENVKNKKDKKMKDQDFNTQKEEKKEEENTRRTSLAVTKEEEKKECKGKEIRKRKDLTTRKEKKAENNTQKIYPLTSKDQESRTKTAVQEERRVFISQLDMSFTQYAFMGLLLAHPTKLGAGAATKREMEGLVHFWRGLGWLLGIEDRYNFCAGTVEDTRSLCLEIERDILLPLLLKANWDYEHMATSLISGMGEILPMSYPAMMRYLAHTLDLPAPALSRSLTWRQWFHYWMLRFKFGLIYYMPGILKKLNMELLSLIAKEKEEDKVNLAAYRKAQAALTIPEQDAGVRSGIRLQR